MSILTRIWGINNHHCLCKLKMSTLILKQYDINFLEARTDKTCDLQWA